MHALMSETALGYIETAWDRLSASSENQNPFMTYGWFRAWLKRLTVDEGPENCSRTCW